MTGFLLGTPVWSADKHVRLLKIHLRIDWHIAIVFHFGIFQLLSHGFIAAIQTIHQHSLKGNAVNNELESPQIAGLKSPLFAVRKVHCDSLTYRL